ncbi:hypothetical protein BDV95DRAFT_611863 [Massariosphaeria phaeospora]|uniref:F-box domain-containing protein n=1 Tax=Massariosphaeria phaeospora TaxID=100035 RepID=A0A7C8I7J4_9PLEO|nr:hypothetical protein BDV95DRAFT_611863 [Massariosphaeria phaeospora]
MVGTDVYDDMFDDDVEADPPDDMLMPFPKKEMWATLEDQDALQFLRNQAYIFGVEAASLQKREYLLLPRRERVRREFDRSHRLYRVDRSRKSFLDLPGELRNRIYSYALVHDDVLPAISLTHDDRGDPNVNYDKFKLREMHYIALEIGRLCRIGRRQYPCLTAEDERKIKEGMPRGIILALQSLGWINHEVRAESRTFFYTHNSFSVFVHESVDFIQAIGRDGRANINTIFFHDRVRDLSPLFQALQLCPNLRHLEFEFWMKSPTHFNSHEPSAFEKGYDFPNVDLSAIRKTCKPLEGLRSLKIHFNFDTVDGSHECLSGMYGKSGEALKSIVRKEFELVYPGVEIDLLLEVQHFVTKARQWCVWRKGFYGWDTLWM